MKDQLLNLGSWLLLASLAIETRWKRNSVLELLHTPNKENKQTIDTVKTTNDNKSVII
jgi:hypothetical protein